MNLLELIQSQLSEDVIARLAASLNESAPRTQQALASGAIPAVLVALAERYAPPEQDHNLTQLLTAGGHDGGLLSDPGSALGGGAYTDALVGVGKGLMLSLLGSRSDAVAELIAATTTLRRSSVSSLLGLAAPLALAVLGQQRLAHDLDDTALQAMLRDARAELPSGAMPGLATALGIHDHPSDAANNAVRHSPWPWIIVPAALLLGGFGLRSCQHDAMHAPPAPAAVPQVRLLPQPVSASPAATVPAVVVPAAVTPAPPEAAPPEAVPPEAAPPEAALVAAPPLLATAPLTPSQGVAAPPAATAPSPAASSATVATPPTLAMITAKIAKGSVAYELALFLADPSRSAPQSFVLHNLNFDPATAVITRESQRVLRDVASVLKAYAIARVMLQGHTDITGDPASNYDLSLARANATRKALIAQGIDASRLTTAGFGADRPLRPNSSAEGRALNRRTELLVTVK